MPFIADSPWHFPQNRNFHQQSHTLCECVCVCVCVWLCNFIQQKLSWGLKPVLSLHFMWSWIFFQPQCWLTPRDQHQRGHRGVSSVQFSRSVKSDSLRPCESQHARPPCPSPSPGVHPDSRPSSTWCHPASHPGSSPSPPAPNPPSIRVFSNDSTLRMRWPKYWSFSFSIIPSKEILGLISFRMDWLDFLSVPEIKCETFCC